MLIAMVIAMVFSEGDLLYATDNFSQVNRLGTGGFGEVYRGWMNGTNVAVKKLTEVCMEFFIASYS